MPAALGTGAQDESFTLGFVYMGQGDCCLVRCPDGRVVVVDCGSSGLSDGNVFAQARRQLRATDWVGPGGTIAALILTHPDKDHYNRVPHLLLDDAYRPDLSVGRIFFSCAVGPSTPLAGYDQGGLNQYVYGGWFGRCPIEEVTINDSGASSREWPWPHNTPTTTPLASKERVVLSGTTPSGLPWSVKIIAGNVAHQAWVPVGEPPGQLLRDDAVANNTASLVTLLTIGGKSALLCGDATFSTEYFLLRNQAASLATVQILQTPHHGSSTTSSSPAFVNGFAGSLRQVVVSVGYNEDNFLLPRYAALERWLERIETNRAPEVPAHAIDYWCEGGSVNGQDAVPHAGQELAAWRAQSSSGVEFKQVGRTWIRTDSLWHDGYFIITACDFLMYRENLTTNLQQTCFGSVTSVLG